jgi:hypothetical protein
MTKKIDFKNEIKSRLNTEIDSQSLASFPPATVSPKNTRQHRFGQGMLIVAVLTAAFGLYIPENDIGGRVMFICFALICAAVGAWHIDRANRALVGRSNNVKSK